MKKTLYQILGVDSRATRDEIEAAYRQRIDELKFATLQDPNKLRVLQQSKEILTDPNQRATYDASISPGSKAAPGPEPHTEESRSTRRPWQWTAVTLVIVAAIGWGRHGSAPPLPPSAQVPVRTAATPSSPAQAPPVETAPAKEAPSAAPPVGAPAAQTSSSPLAGEWSCEDALTGHSSKYNFQQNGSLFMATSNGQLLDFKYELEGSALKVTDATASRVFALEELTARKMILNLGGPGQRVVCRR
jgi:DnaJ-like protein